MYANSLNCIKAWQQKTLLLAGKKGLNKGLALFVDIRRT